jgi:plastocyanin
MVQLTRSPRAQSLTRTAFAGLPMIVVTGLLLAACTGGAASPGAAASSGGAGASSGASSGTGASTATIENLAFSPATLNVTAGTTVTFSNRDAIGHTAVNGVNGVADPNALFNLDLPAGTAGTFKFDKLGTYQVTCTIHPGMHMTIVVK